MASTRYESAEKIGSEPPTFIKIEKIELIERSTMEKAIDLINRCEHQVKMVERGRSVCPSQSSSGGGTRVASEPCYPLTKIRREAARIHKGFPRSVTSLLRYVKRLRGSAKDSHAAPFTRSDDCSESKICGQHKTTSPEIDQGLPARAARTLCWCSVLQLLAVPRRAFFGFPPRALALHSFGLLLAPCSFGRLRHHAWILPLLRPSGLCRTAPR